MTFEKIREMLSRQMDIPEESITMDSRLVEDLKADSLDVVELIMDIEQEYGIQVPEGLLSSFALRTRRQSEHH